MIQNFIALTIVFAATGYTVFSIIKNLTAKKSKKCGGCSDCSFNDSSIANPAKAQANSNIVQNFILVKHGK